MDSNRSIKTVYWGLQGKPQARQAGKERGSREGTKVMLLELRQHGGQPPGHRQTQVKERSFRKNSRESQSIINYGV